jgi:hypothetical protein
MRTTGHACSFVEVSSVFIEREGREPKQGKLLLFICKLWLPSRIRLVKVQVKMSATCGLNKGKNKEQKGEQDAKPSNLMDFQIDSIELHICQWKQKAPSFSFWGVIIASTMRQGQPADWILLPNPAYYHFHCFLFKFYRKLYKLVSCPAW